MHQTTSFHKSRLFRGRGRKPPRRSGATLRRGCPHPHRSIVVGSWSLRRVPPTRLMPSRLRRVARLAQATTEARVVRVHALVLELLAALRVVVSLSGERGAADDAYGLPGEYLLPESPVPLVVLALCGGASPPRCPTLARLHLVLEMGMRLGQPAVEHGLVIGGMLTSAMDGPDRGSTGLLAVRRCLLRVT